MKLIIGLGNPGKKYENTWHNLGFIAVERFRQDFELPKFKKSAKLKAEICRGKINGIKIIIAKPQIFMNNSGLAVGAVAKYYKIKTEDIIVVHDDIDLPLGKIRVTKDSSAGGHNGVKSIIAHLSSQKFARIKIGIRTDQTEKIGALDYVLEKVAKKYSKTAIEATKKAVLAAEMAISERLEKAMNKFN